MKSILSLFSKRPDFESEAILLRAENAVLRREIKNLTHQFGVQRARTGDQKSIVKLLRARLVSMGDIADPVAAVLKEQNQVGIDKEAVRKIKRAATKKMIREAANKPRSEP